MRALLSDEYERQVMCRAFLEYWDIRVRHLCRGMLCECFMNAVWMVITAFFLSMCFEFMVPFYSEMLTIRKNVRNL